MPKMHLNTFGGRAPPGPSGEALALPQTPEAQWRGLLLREGKRREGRGRAKMEREKEGKKGGEALTPGLRPPKR